MEIQTEHWPELLRRITIEMTKRCKIMSLEDIKEGIYLCSKLLSKVMPSMKPVDKDRAASEQRKDLEGSSEHELNGWSIIEFKRNARDESKGEKSLESSQEVFMEEPGQSEGTKGEETIRIEEEKPVALSEKGVDDEAEDGDGEGDSEDKYEDTQEELDEWSDFQEVEQGNEKLRTSGFESESSTVDREARISEKDEGQKGQTLGKDAREGTRTQQPFQSSLIQACVKYFQDFFARFVVERVLKHLNSLCRGRVNALGTTNKECYTALRASGLISDGMWRLVDQGDRPASEKITEDACKKQGTLRERRNVVGPTMLVSSFRSMQSCRNCAEAFVAACKLLLELSCFPVCAEKDSESCKTSSDENKGM